LVVVCWIVVPLLGLEFLLRQYEGRFLIHREAIQVQQDVLRLAGMGYNEWPVRIHRTPPGFRILSIGDSFAYGIVRPTYNYSHVLADQLSGSLPMKVEAINLGRSGTSFPEYLNEIDFWTQRLEYDAILVNVYGGNDFSNVGTTLYINDKEFDPADSTVKASTAALPHLSGGAASIPHKYSLRVFDYFLALTGGWLYSRIAPDPRYTASVLGFPLRQYLEIQAETVPPYVLGEALKERYAFQYLARLLAKLSELEQEGKKTCVFVSPPHWLVSEGLSRRVLAISGFAPTAIEAELPARLVQAVAQKVGYRGVLDLAPCLRRADVPGDPLYFPGNTHWSLRGNRTVGELLASYLGKEWFATDGSNRDPGCTLQVSAATLDPRLLSTITETLDTTLAAQDRVLFLRQRQFASPAELEQTLRAENFGKSETIEGAVKTLVPLKKYSQACGVVRDSNLSSSLGDLQVSLFHNGWLTAAGIARYPNRDPQSGELLRRYRQSGYWFRFSVPAPCDILKDPQRTWYLVTNPERQYAWLEVPEGLSCLPRFPLKPQP
jgi:hypothetical protein